jgi:hypothetical protein
MAAEAGPAASGARDAARTSKWESGGDAANRALSDGEQRVRTLAAQ